MARIKTIGTKVATDSSGAPVTTKAFGDSSFVAGHKGVKAPGKHGGGIVNRVGKGWTNTTKSGWR